jgi:hypothetical protein
MKQSILGLVPMRMAGGRLGALLLGLRGTGNQPVAVSAATAHEQAIERVERQRDALLLDGRRSHQLISMLL